MGSGEIVRYTSLAKAGPEAMDAHVSAKAEQRQDGNNDDDETDEPDDAVDTPLANKCVQGSQFRRVRHIHPDPLTCGFQEASRMELQLKCRESSFTSAGSAQADRDPRLP